MAEESGIEWTRSTFNPWIGCTKVGPGCDGCYAEALDKRMRFGGNVHWGANVPRMRTSPGNWKGPLKWNEQALNSEFAGRKGFWPVFCASLADVFDNEVPDEWRADLMQLIEKTPHLSWLLVTKRIGNVARMIEEAGDLIDYGEGWQSMWGQGAWPENVRLMITVVNQEEADRDVPKLLELPCKNGVSYEPALGPVNWTRWLDPTGVECMDVCPGHSYVVAGEVEEVMRGNERIPLCPDCGIPATWTGYDKGLDWIIVGGESSQGSHKARYFDLAWARSTVEQCKLAGVPCFVKQLGSVWAAPDDSGERIPVRRDRGGADPAEWPADLRVQEFPL